MKGLRATDVIGKPVRNRAGENLGEISDVVLRPESGRIAYGVLAFGGVLGIGDKLFAVPWSALRETPDHDGFLLDIASERLDGAPGFDKHHWPELCDSRFGNAVYSYYGVAP